IDCLKKNQSALLQKGFSFTQAKCDRRIFIGQTSLEMTIEEGNDWFDIQAVAHFGPYEIPFIALREHILNKNKEFTLPNGEIAIIPEEWFSQYEHLFLFTTNKQSLKLNKSHIGLLYEISEH